MKENFEINYECSGCKFCYSKTEMISEREIHDYYEVLCYLGGGATLLTETFSQKLKEPSLIFIPKGKFHSLSLENPSDFRRLKISFDDANIVKEINTALLDKVSVISNVKSSAVLLLSKVLTCLKDKTYADSLFFYGVLFIVLSEFSNVNDLEIGYTNPSSTIKEIIKYVEENINNDLSLESISANLNFSPSTISHSFKKEMGVSIHKYVVQKRLIYAKELLDEGKLPTEVYCLCGYSNYSSFYKAYLKMWGTNPKKQK